MNLSDMKEKIQNHFCTETSHPYVDINIHNITASYGSKNVLNNFSHTFQGGSISVIMTPSGTGKTTLLNIINGTFLINSKVSPLSGSSDIPLLNGRISFNIKNTDTPIIPLISMVFQENRLMEHTDVATNILCAINTHGQHYKPQELIPHLCALGFSKDILYAPVNSLSGGMKRRIAILRSLLAPSHILLLDEPFKGLDEELKKDVIDYVKANISGRTVILITHEEKEALCFSHKTSIITSLD